MRSIYSRYRIIIQTVVLFIVLEYFYNTSSFRITRPSKPLDPVFSSQCREPDTSQPRENATILMLARNSDVAGAVASIRSLENTFNQWYHYPITFLNEEPFDAKFREALSHEASGGAAFLTIDSTLWGFPPYIDAATAKQSIKSQGETHVMYSGLESYHHMCRFNSGGFYDVPELQKYRWYWRVEPDVEFTCAITYDPFAAMRRNNKRYGYILALWELGKTCPTLFNTVAAWKSRMKVKTTSLWTAMMEASWAPLPLRWLLSWQPHHDASGNSYNLCHFWSNFEIADMDWYRSDEYRAFFRMLDESGGFYSERWGDAPVHSLAAALLLEPQEVHYFADFGYVHGNFQYCPYNAKGGQLPGSEKLDQVRDLHNEPLEEELEGALGCRCRCPRGNKVAIETDCLDRIRMSVE